MTTINWAVTALHTKKIKTKSNFVVMANYEVIGINGDFTASISNTAQFSTDTITGFIPYADLTNEIVVSWIKEGLGADGVTNFEACVQGQINSLINPPVASDLTPLPF